MAYKNKTQIKALFLLLVYLAGSGLVPLFHSHNNKVPLSNATNCEKSIYFNGLGQEKKCKHQSHIVEAKHICLKCNLSKINQYCFVLTPVFEFFAKKSIHYNETDFQYCKQLTLGFTNKGPPNSTILFI